jgi:3-phosphoshikimate 1-carboxyvinyltransferase
MLGAIAEGKTSIDNFAKSQDCQSTLSCLRHLGTSVDIRQPDSVVILGKGLRGLNAPAMVLDAGNSGSTIRMLSGILSGQKFMSRISGDESLRRRPMKRVIDPLAQMGAKVQAIQGNYPPLTINGAPLKAIQYTMPVASAQVKSAVLLAGLYAEGETEVIELNPTRNHTELAIKEFHGAISVNGGKISLKGWQRLEGTNAKVPGDISSGAFFIVAATLLPGSELFLEEIGLNPSRRAIVELLNSMGACIEVLDERVQSGETRGDLLVKPAPLKGGLISKRQVPQLIDEIPILAVMATQTQEGLEIRDAGELRVKESDRISSIARNLRALGADVEEFADGMFVPGRQSLRGSLIHTFGDHRIAMAFAIAGFLARGETCIEGSECVSVSFPNFFEMLDSVTIR